jgi:hypothetical protein
MCSRTKTILNTTDFTALYDKGYHTGTELKTAIDLGKRMGICRVLFFNDWRINFSFSNG